MKDQISAIKKAATWTFGVMNLRKKFHVDILGDGRATVKREDGLLAEPPAVLDL